MAKPLILIAEDEPMLAVMIGIAIEDLGATAMDPVCRVSDAMSLLDSTKIDGAVIDFDLTDGFATPLALELEKRSVPFAIYSGNYLPEEAKIALPNAPFFLKPVSMLQVIGFVFRGITERRIRGSSDRPKAGPDFNYML